MRRSFFKLFLAIAMAIQPSAAGAGDIDLSFGYEGRVVTAAGAPVTATGAVFRVQILSPQADCLLYEATQTVDLSGGGIAAAQGLFSLKIGGGAMSVTGASPGLDFRTLFSNLTTPLRNSGTNCSAGYTPNPADPRVLRVYLDEDGAGPLNSELILEHETASVPSAFVAQTLQGLSPSAFVKVADLPATTCNPSSEKLHFNGTTWSCVSDLGTVGGFLDLTSGGVKVANVPPTPDSAINRTYADSYVGGRRVDTANLAGLASGDSLRWDATANGGAGGWVRYTPLNPAAVVASVTGAGPVKATGTTAVTVDLEWSDGLMVSGGSLKAKAGVGVLVSATGIAADFGTGAGQVMRADGVPSCAANEKLQMSLGPNYAWTCVPDAGAELPNPMYFELDGANNFYLGANGSDTAAKRQAVTVNADLSTGEILRMNLNVRGNAAVSITPDGNVGVGTNAPAAKLDVAGAVRVGSASVLVCTPSVTGALRSQVGVLEYCDGSTWKSVIGSGGVNSVLAAAPLSSTGGTDPQISLNFGPTLITSGGLLDVNAGSGANQIVQLDGSGRLPGLDGSQLLNVSGANLSGTVPLTKGGTGATTAFAARTNLGLGSAATANIGASFMDVMSAASVPNCLASEKLQMSSGPVFTWSCVSDQIGTELPVAAGSAVAPAYSFQGDMDTGVFSPGVNQLGFATAGAERLRILSNGHVGIGVGSPTEALHVGGAIRVGTTTGTNAGTIRWDGTNFQGYTGSSWVNLSGSAAGGGTSCDTTQTFATPGTYTYNVPAAFGTITIRMWGAGGGGGGANATMVHASGSGANGTASSIASLGLAAGGGFGGGMASLATNIGSSGAGGSASGGTVNTNGGSGEGGVNGVRGGNGGSSPNGGNGGLGAVGGGLGITGNAPGGGGGGSSGGTTHVAGGGGAGAYVEKVFTAATLLPGTNLNDIVVGMGGSGGTGGTGGFAGGSGGSGRISIACASTGAPPVNDRTVLFMDGANYSNNTNFVYTANGDLGIGTNSPGARLDVNGKIAVSATGQPTLTLCGTGANVVGNDTRGVVTMGSGSPTACTLNFHSAFVTTPVCVVTPNSSGPAHHLSSVTFSSFTVTLSSAAPGYRFSYICLQ